MSPSDAARPPRGTGNRPVPPDPSGRGKACVRRERIRLVLACSAAGALLTGCFAAGHTATGGRGGHPPVRNQTPLTPAHSKPAQAPPGFPDTRTPASTDADNALTRLLEPIRAQSGTRVSIAVLEPGTGRRMVHGSQTHITASLAKVNILAALLLRAQREGRSLTPWETSTAASMIRSSDNDSAGALWQRIGGGPGLAAANKVLGLTSTQAGPGTHWGLTRTTAADQLTLLKTVFAGPSPLSEASRHLIQTFMGRIDADQDWGISAEGSRWQLKNGWVQRSHSQRWAINSMGRVAAHGSTFYVVVLSHGSPSMSHGISTVERAARTAVHALRGTAPPVSPIIH
ncbi:Beta-lactamase class A [Streptomyces prasinopilosus]|uniref:Beta-lactamase class A n=1 Tax=Streptomyces prasinopilosus TaxID=67344 RepID=A0A1G6WL81_9ACTN|nr:Beta-lactamase class A [Streptomyces prasinopilosus]